MKYIYILHHYSSAIHFSLSILNTPMSTCFISVHVQPTLTLSDTGQEVEVCHTVKAAHTVDQDL